MTKSREKISTYKRNSLLITVLLLFQITAFSQDCNCDFTIPLTQSNVDGNTMTYKPGDTICIEAGARKQLRFINLHGDSLNYLVIKNCGGSVVVENDDLGYGINILRSSFFRFTGTGSSSSKYGIKVLKTRAGTDGLSIDGMCTNYEIDHIEISNTGFAGIKAYTHPTCDKTANFGNFVQRNTIIHDNFIHHTGGEGMYIGHSYFSGITKLCNGDAEILLPHELKGVRVYNNRIDSSGWDGIQVSCATEDCEIYDNNITNYGVAQVENQNSGIQIGGGTTGKCFNNAVFNGSGTGIAIFGIGNNTLFNNVIVRSGKSNDSDLNAYGIFLDDRTTTPNMHFNLINNTIVAPSADGIRIHSLLSNNIKVYNNLIVKPGTFDKYKDKSLSYVYYNKFEDLDISNNYFTQLLPPFNELTNISEIENFTSSLPIKNKGIDVKSFDFIFDFNRTNRVKHGITDIGAFEFENASNLIKNGSKYSIFPNPTQGSFILRNNEGEDILKYSILNINGQTVSNEQNGGGSLVSVKLNNSFNKGIYLLKIKTKTKTSIEKFHIN